MDKEFHKTFDHCPACGSDQQFCKELGEELRERSLARPEFIMRYDMRQGVVVDQNRAAPMPIGINLPGGSITTDICMDCGAVYAVDIQRIEGRTQAAPLPTGNKPLPAFDKFSLGNIRAN